MTVFALGRLRHVDLLELAARMRPGDRELHWLARMSKERLIEWLCREARTAR